VLTDRVLSLWPPSLARDRIAQVPNVRLNLASSPRNVLLVRQVLAGLAEPLKLDRIEFNDVVTSVSEACNNVALHAYAGGEGPMDVEVCALAGELCVVVRDHGRGMRAPAAGPQQRNPIGLRLIETLTDRVDYLDVPDGGTELRMFFATAGTHQLPAAREQDPLKLCATSHSDSAQATRIAIVPCTLARSVLPRVFAVLATHADFSIDRVSDTQILVDALVAGVEASPSAHPLEVNVRLAPRRLELRIGPLRAGAGDALLRDSAAGELGPVIERLTNGSHAISPAGPFEVLTLQLTGR
jgi:serine/threonine-protein kinase RsbW